MIFFSCITIFPKESYTLRTAQHLWLAVICSLLEMRWWPTMSQFLDINSLKAVVVFFLLPFEKFFWVKLFFSRQNVNLHRFFELTSSPGTWYFYNCSIPSIGGTLSFFRNTVAVKNVTTAGYLYFYGGYFAFGGRGGRSHHNGFLFHGKQAQLISWHYDFILLLFFLGGGEALFQRSIYSINWKIERWNTFIFQKG